MKKSFVFALLIFTTLYFSFSQTKPDALREYNAGNYLRAIEICEKEIQENDKNMDSYAVLCWSLIANKQYNEAEFWANHARKIAQYDQRIIEALAEAKYYLGKNQESLSLFQEYLSLVSLSASRSGLAYYFMGEIFIRQAKYQHADIALSQAVTIEPLKDFWWVRLAYTRELARSYGAALLAYNQALALSPFLEDAVSGRERVKKLIR